MSHVATIDIQVKDLDALRAACTALGLEFREGQQTFKWYGHWADDYDAADAAYHHGIKPEDYGKCEHAIAVPGNSPAYEVGVVRRADGKPGYHLVYDFYRGGYGLQEAIGAKAGKLRQQYAAQVAIKQARKQGYRVQQTVGTDGKVRLTCTK